MSIDMGRRIVALGALSSCHFFSLSVSGCMGLAPQPEVQVFAFLPQDEGKDGVVLSAFHTRSKFAFGGRGRTTQPSPTPRTDFD